MHSDVGHKASQGGSEVATCDAATTASASSRFGRRCVPGTFLRKIKFLHKGQLGSRSPDTIGQCVALASVGIGNCGSGPLRAGMVRPPPAPPPSREVGGATQHLFAANGGCLDVFLLSDFEKTFRLSRRDESFPPEVSWSRDSVHSSHRPLTCQM